MHAEINEKAEGNIQEIITLFGLLLFIKYLTVVL